MKVPTGQSVQLEASVELLKVPGEHLVAFVEPAGQYDPGVHGKLDPLKQYDPLLLGPQATPIKERVVLAQGHTGQGLQV